jgi:hypothetical protein
MTADLPFSPSDLRRLGFSEREVNRLLFLLWLRISGRWDVEGGKPK